MKTVKLFLALILLATLTMWLAAPQVALAAPLAPTQGPDGDQVVLGGSYELDDGESLDGNLVVLGGNAILNGGSAVHGDVVVLGGQAKVMEDANVGGNLTVLGGNMTVDGQVAGDVNILGGVVNLGATAVVQGDVNAASAHLVRNDGAQIEGDINTDMSFAIPFVWKGSLRLPNTENQPLVVPNAPIVHVFDGFNPLVSLMWWVARSFIWALLAVLAMLFLARRAERTGAAGISQPIGAGCLGCLTSVFIPLVLVFVFITICGIPFSLLGALALVLAWAFGVIALGLEVGKRLADLLKQDWAPAVSAGVGTFTLTLVANGLGMIPCVGWMIPWLVGAIGLGAVLLTQFGGQDYPPAPLAPVPSAPVGPVIDAPEAAPLVLDQPEEDVPDQD